MHINYRRDKVDGMTAILESEDKMVNKTFGPSGVLSRLWRTILRDTGIGPTRYGEILNEHVLNPMNGVPNNRRDQISYRGNLTKELAKSQMTWKVFIKALKFLNVVKIELTIKAYHSNAKVTQHMTVVRLGGRHSEGTAAFNAALEQSEDDEAVINLDYLDDAELVPNNLETKDNK